jgi:hypothetical protein
MLQKTLEELMKDEIHHSQHFRSTTSELVLSILWERVRAPGREFYDLRSTGISIYTIESRAGVSLSVKLLIPGGREQQAKKRNKG